MKIKCFVSAFVVSISIISCNNKNKDLVTPQSTTSKLNQINMIKNSKYNTNIETLKASMINYLEIADNPYSKEDVDETAHILNLYLNDIENSKSKEDGMRIVKNTVEKLNSLNEKCNMQLIETDEREQIAEIIILASSDKGYNNHEDDITEEWREW